MRVLAVLTLVRPLQIIESIVEGGQFPPFDRNSFSSLSVLPKWRFFPFVIGAYIFFERLRVVFLRYHSIKLKELLKGNVLPVVDKHLLSLGNWPYCIYLFIHAAELNLALGIGAVVEEV